MTWTITYIDLTNLNKKIHVARWDSKKWQNKQGKEEEEENGKEKENSFKMKYTLF